MGERMIDKTDELPPLPEFDSFADRNKAIDYARAAIAPYKAEIERLKETQQKFGILQHSFMEENAKLRELLERAADCLFECGIRNEIHEALREKP